MYTTCIHCQQSLGANESIEALPIGRRLAFDGEKGRLWVVCRQCERAYRDTRVRDGIRLIEMAGGPERFGALRQRLI